MSNLTKPPILDETGQDILTALGDIKRNLPQGGGSNGYTPTDATEATLADDDKVPFYDTSASGKRNSTWANIKAKLKAYFDGIYAADTAQNVSYPSGYNTQPLTHPYEFGQETSVQGKVTNVLDYIQALADGLRTAINDHGSLIAYLRANMASKSDTVGTYEKSTYSNHEFDSTTLETNKSAVYMANTTNSAMKAAINDHADWINNVTAGTYTEVPYDTTTHNFDESQAVTHLNEPVLNMVSMNQDGLLDAIDDHADLIGKLRVEKTLAEFNALTPAEQDDPEIVYYITDKPSLGYPVQDDGTATDLTDGALATGRTLESWANNNLVKYKIVSLPSAVTVAANANGVGLTTFSGGVPVAFSIENYNDATINNLIPYITKWYSTWYLSVKNTGGAVVTVPKDMRLFVAYL